MLIGGMLGTAPPRTLMSTAFMTAPPRRALTRYSASREVNSTPSGGHAFGSIMRLSE